MTSNHSNPTHVHDHEHDVNHVGADAMTGIRDWNMDSIRRDFPILKREVNGTRLVYLDNAATSQKPVHVIAELTRYYRDYNANIHRGVHTLSQEATAAYEGARERVRRFINARSSREIIFTRGTTESINLVAQSFGRPRLRPGDEILITGLEHHANIVPWQMLREQTGCVLKVAPIDRRGEMPFDSFAALIGPRTRLIAVAHVSNALGTVNDLPAPDETKRLKDEKVKAVRDRIEKNTSR